MRLPYTSVLLGSVSTAWRSSGCLSGRSTAVAPCPCSASSFATRTRPSGAARLYADRAFLIPAFRRPRSFASVALAERAKTLDFAGCWVRNPASVFAVLGEVLPLFLAISGYFWLFLGWVRPQVGRAQN